MNETLSYQDVLRYELVAASRRLTLHRQAELASGPNRRGRWPAVRLAIAGVLALTVAAFVAVSVLGLGGGTQRAIAEWGRWTPAPTPPAHGQIGVAESACLAEAQKLRIAAPPWHVLAADARGPFTLMLLQTDSHDAIATCLSAASAASITAGASGYPGGIPPTVPPGQIRLEGGGSDRFPEPDESGHQYSTAYGQVGADVSSVTLLLADHERVTASVENGWFLAWWPRWTLPVAAVVTTPRGTTVDHQLFPTPARR